MFILASSSPRRIQILKTIIEDFVVVKPTFDESLISKKSKNYAMEESLNMALSVKNYAKPQDFILSCDTFIVFNNEIIGKPKDRNDAFLTLKKLSNNTHYVISGYTILHEDKIINREIKSQITFSELDDDFINYYIDNYEVMDAILHLPNKYKNVIYMYYFEDYKANEIAGILNIPVNTVYSLLKRGKEKLKGVLDESL